VEIRDRILEWLAGVGGWQFYFCFQTDAWNLARPASGAQTAATSPIRANAIGCEDTVNDKDLKHYQ
jgi:hypothetical protein